MALSGTELLSVTHLRLKNSQVLRKRLLLVCRDTLSQNTHACGAVAPAGSDGGGTARVLLPGCRDTGGTSPSQGNLRSQGGEGCAAAKRRGKHSRGWSGDDSGIDPLELLRDSSELSSCSSFSNEKPPAMGGQEL